MFRYEEGTAPEGTTDAVSSHPKRANVLRLGSGVELKWSSQPLSLCELQQGFSRTP